MALFCRSVGSVFVAVGPEIYPSEIKLDGPSAAIGRGFKSNGGARCGLSSAPSSCSCRAAAAPVGLPNIHSRRVGQQDPYQLLTEGNEIYRSKSMTCGWEKHPTCRTEQRTEKHFHKRGKAFLADPPGERGSGAAFGPETAAVERVARYNSWVSRRWPVVV